MLSNMQEIVNNILIIMQANSTLDGFFGIFIRIIVILKQPSTISDKNEATF